MLMSRAVTRTLIWGCIFIYSCFAQQISFQIDEFEFDLKRNPSAEHEFMNIHIPINVLVMPVDENKIEQPSAHCAKVCTRNSELEKSTICYIKSLVNKI